MFSLYMFRAARLAIYVYYGLCNLGVCAVFGIAQEVIRRFLQFSRAQFLQFPPKMN